MLTRTLTVLCGALSMPVSALGVDLAGRYMVTAGMDSRVKVWDVRTFKPLHDYFSTSPVHTLDIRWAVRR